MINLNLEEVVSQSFIDISKKEDVKNLIFSMEENFIRQNSAQGDVDSITLQELLPKIYTKINESYPQINNFNKIFSDIKNGNLRTLYDYINNTEDVTDNVLIEYKSYLLNFITNIQKTIDSKLPLTKQVMKGGEREYQTDLNILEKYLLTKVPETDPHIRFNMIFNFIKYDNDKNILLLFESQYKYGVHELIKIFKEQFEKLDEYWDDIDNNFKKQIVDEYKATKNTPTLEEYTEGVKILKKSYETFINKNPITFDFDGIQNIIFEDDNGDTILEGNIISKLRLDVTNNSIELIDDNNNFIQNINSCFEYIRNSGPPMTEIYDPNKQNLSAEEITKNLPQLQSDLIVSSARTADEELSALFDEDPSKQTFNVERDSLPFPGNGQPPSVAEKDNQEMFLEPILKKSDKFDYIDAFKYWFENDDKFPINILNMFYEPSDIEIKYTPIPFDDETVLSRIYTTEGRYLKAIVFNLKLSKKEKSNMENQIKIEKKKIKTDNFVRFSLLLTELRAIYTKFDEKNKNRYKYIQHNYEQLIKKIDIDTVTDTSVNLAIIKKKQTALKLKVKENDIEIIAHKEFFANIVFYILMVIIYVYIFLFINTCYNEAKANLSTVTDSITDNIVTQGISTVGSTVGSFVDSATGKNFTESISNSDLANSAIALAKTGAKIGAVAVLANVFNVDTIGLYTMLTGFFCLTVGIGRWVRPWSNSLSRNLIYDLHKNTLGRVLNTFSLKEDYKKISDGAVFIDAFVQKNHTKTYNDIKYFADTIAALDDTNPKEIAVMISAQKDFTSTLEPDPYGIRKLVNGAGSMFLNFGRILSFPFRATERGVSAPVRQASTHQAPSSQAPVRQASTHQAPNDNCTYTNKPDEFEEFEEFGGGKKTTRKYKTRKYKNKTKKYKNKKYKTKKYKNKKYKTRKNNTKKNKMKGGSSQDFLISETQIAIINIFKIFISPEEYPIDSISSVFDEIFQIVSKIRIPTRLINTDFLLD